MDSICKELEKFNFTPTEAEVYLTLVKHGTTNGSQIAKLMNISRSSVYSAINNLVDKGYIYHVPGDTNEYTARDPKTLLAELKDYYDNAAENLSSQFDKLKKHNDDYHYTNIKGQQTFIGKSKELILQAEKEIYINTCMDLHIFEKEIKIVRNRGIKIIVMTFDNLSLNDLDVELYKSEIKGECGEEIRMMLVIDQQVALIASDMGVGEVFGTFSTNPLLVSIVSEHIHHDIYITKLKEKFGDDIIDSSISINSYFEKIREGRIN